MHAIHQHTTQRYEWDLGKDIPAVLGLTTLFSSLLIYSAVMMGFRRFQHVEDVMGTFAPVLLLGTLVASVMLFALALKRSLFSSKTLCGVGGLLSIVGAVMFCMFITGYEAPELVVVVFAIASGVGEVMVCCVWGRIGKRWFLEKALILVVIAFALALGIELLISFFAGPLALGLFIICTVVAALLPVFMPTLEAPVEQASSDTTSIHVLKALQEQALEPASGVLVFAFCLGSMRALFWAAHNEYIAGSLGAVIVAVLVLVVPRRQSLARLFSVVIIPSCAVALLAVNNIVLLVGQGDFWAQSLLYLFFGLAIILTLATLSATAHGGEISGDVLFTGMLALFAFASLAGQATAEFCSDSVIEALVSVVIALYAVAVVIMRSVRIDKAWGTFADFDAQSVHANMQALNQGGGTSSVVVPPASLSGTSATSQNGTQVTLSCAEYEMFAPEDAGFESGSMHTTQETYSSSAHAQNGYKEELSEETLSADEGNSTLTRQEACEVIARQYGLTSREQEILALLARGHNGVYISEILFISPNTVRTHIHNIYRKLGVSSREEVLSMTNPEYRVVK